MPVFDGHNDALSRLWNAGGDPAALFAQDVGHVNVPACAAGDMRGGFFAVYSPAKRNAFFDLPPATPALPLPPPLDPGSASVSAMAQVGIAHALQRAGQIQIVTSKQQLDVSWDAVPITCVLHLEGAECIDADLLALEALHGAGLRSLGPVWSRPNAWGHGVPFAYPQDPDTGPGLTDAGHRLAQRCAQLGIMLDVSHLTRKGFDDIANLGLPVVATHSNAWDLCPSARNLTLDQMAIIAGSGGLAGVNYEPSFTSEAGWRTGQSTLAQQVDQIAYMVDKMGEDHVVLGSDFDGARTPQGMRSAADLPRLSAAMDTAGFGQDLIDKITHKTWRAFLGRHLGDA
ncbi:MAG: membrane dipeptidase [Pseudomonadota bacterium]